MQRILPLLLFCCLAFPALSQTFSPDPGAVLQRETALEQATECYIFFNNPSGDSLQLRWKKIETSVPAGWAIDLCDYGLCYTGIPASGLMNTAADTARPYLKLIVQPGTTPGAAWLWFRVWQNGNPANTQDVFFDLHTPGTSAVQEAPLPEISIFPNPAPGAVWLRHNGARALPAALRDVSGKILWQGALPAGENLRLELAAWPAGAYFLQTAHTTHTILHR